MFNIKGVSKFFVLLFIIAFLHLITQQDVNAQVTSTNTKQPELAKDAKSAILIEQRTGAILYDKKAHQVLPPASMTKLMTLLLIMEELDKETITLDENIRVSEHAASMGGSQIFLEAGEEMKVEDLLKGIAIASANDASVALAERIAGTEDAFVKKMNLKARELGLENTNFKNPTGLPAAEHKSTAYDMAIIAKELLNYKEITSYTGKYEDYLRKGQENEFWLVNTNKLVKFYDGVDGLKTGYTNEAKYCLTATANKNNMRTIAVVMGAETSKERNQSVSTLLDFAYQNYEAIKLYEKGDKVTDLKILKAKKNNYDVVLKEDIFLIRKKEEKNNSYETKWELSKNIVPPLQKEEKIGMLGIFQDGKKIGEGELIVEQKIEKANLIQLFRTSMHELMLR
ncbi:D-alanyl-D-alanine carboxypeptidase family protein [Saliterribacillus persicus]|uniref:serine-type D-Ala-D-Ala carboxypeptidase n=1 Tax=Saliterribacillus persicus TaxID=930114 RepID=A0A368XCA1_9BACI|nr:D-alanyl-D-alanine carboxypeptidase family protein [Saliterribacillus persicus]RCW64856.1 D-Ala-D-Ala carboxypeptidase DacF [Saliterribacillus persicus]